MVFMHFTQQMKHLQDNIPYYKPCNIPTKENAKNQSIKHQYNS